jgi:hypothetical protein
MTVREYWSGDTSAPSLTGQAGGLITVLDAILVNGYGSQTAAGWTKTFSGTNKANYKNTGTGAVLYVDDSAAGTGGAKEARVTGFKTDTALGTGTGQFPTAAQSTIGIGMLIVRKSTTADGTVRGWRCLADGTFFYLFTETGDYTGPVTAFGFGFGDFTAQGSSDTSNAMIKGRTIENSNLANNGSSTAAEPFAQLTLPNTTSLSNTTPGQYTMANGANQGGSLAFGKHSDQTKMGWSGSGTGMQMGFLGEWHNGGSAGRWVNNFAFPNPFDIATYAGKVFIHQQGAVRGILKNLHCPLQNVPFNHGDQITGTGDFAGKTFRVINLVGILDPGSNVATQAQCFLQVP